MWVGLELEWRVVERFRDNLKRYGKEDRCVLSIGILHLNHGYKRFVFHTPRLPPRNTQRRLRNAFVGRNANEDGTREFNPGRCEPRWT